MKLHVLLLAALPMCLGQFSIQGPSDGHRRAQGLKFSQDKGIEYDDQRASLGAGDFSIQGATDGHSNFQIQGASDGHSDFEIQGPTDSGVNFHIQGATDGHSQSVIQGPYDGNHQHRPAQAPQAPQAQAPVPVYPHQQPVAYSSGNAKSLSYNDPATGLRVNWKSYDRAARPQQHPQPQPQPQPQLQPQYLEGAGAAAPVHAAPPPRAHPQPQANYKVFNTVPPHIKQLLQFQAQAPYVNSIPDHLRFEALAAAQARAQQQPDAQYQQEPASKPHYRPKPQPPSRHRRQAPQQHQHQQQQQRQPQYQRLPGPPPQQSINYSPNLPPHLQDLLKYQQQTPYTNVIPAQFRYDVDAAVQAQAEQVRSHYEKLAREQAQRSAQGASHQRQRRQAQQHSQQQYSTNLPSHIQQLLKYQAQIPYNIIANQIVYRPDKPYVPQPVQAQQQQQQHQYQAQQQQQQQQYQAQQPVQQAQYQGAGGAYEAQQRQYAQAQYQGQYSQGGPGIRPVTEKQY